MGRKMVEVAVLLVICVTATVTTLRTMASAGTGSSVNRLNMLPSATDRPDVCKHTQDA